MMMIFRVTRTWDVEAESVSAAVAAAPLTAPPTQETVARILTDAHTRQFRFSFDPYDNPDAVLDESPTALGEVRRRTGPVAPPHVVDAHLPEGMS